MAHARVANAPGNQEQRHENQKPTNHSKPVLIIPWSINTKVPLTPTHSKLRTPTLPSASTGATSRPLPPPCLAPGPSGSTTTPGKPLRQRALPQLRRHVEPGQAVQP